jgi:hypothetical protein
MQAFLAFAIAASPAATTSNVVGGYENAAKAVEDCLASTDGMMVDQNKLTKLGWKKAKLGGSMASLKGIMTPYVHARAPLMLVMSISCIVKFNIDPADSGGLADVLSQRLGVQSTKPSEGKWVWNTPKAGIEFTSPANADAQASIVVQLSFRTTREE